MPHLDLGYRAAENKDEEVYMRVFQAKIAWLLLIAFLGKRFMGCGKPVPKLEDVQGKWLAIKKEAYTLGGGEMVGFTIAFAADKTVTLPSGKGTWTIRQDGLVQIDVPNMVMTGELDKGLLTITMPENQGKVIFKKQ
ncbi:MAG: hypothetical protein NTW80_08755 [Deltaproteobacteria bacterium]|nr:hypothetical protein [Deltaproteobacteria bacterium]